MGVPLFLALSCLKIKWLAFQSNWHIKLWPNNQTETFSFTMRWECCEPPVFLAPLSSTIQENYWSMVPSSLNSTTREDRSYQYLFDVHKFHCVKYFNLTIRPKSSLWSWVIYFVRAGFLYFKGWTLYMNWEDPNPQLQGLEQIYFLWLLQALQHENLEHL